MKTITGGLFATFKLDYRHSDFWAALIVFGGGGALALTLILEHVFNLLPCALCLTQRYLMFIGVFIAMLSSVVDSRLGILPLLSILAFVVGIGFALRHVGLIFEIFDTSNCTAGVDFLLEEEYPAHHIFKALFQGSVDCDDSSPVIPFLALAAFLSLIAMAIQQFRLGPKSAR
ncbi:MAG: disulfide bond formation protein B [Gammaproteobacteria bacterium]|nr:disulfide bond formation protein B [Gammaproteobacteria bacterium]